MKLKEMIYGLGVRPPSREYGFDITRFELETDGVVEYAVWRHPREKRKVFNQAQVDEIRAFLPAGAYAIDVGAHSGDSALPIALAAGPAGGVFALEPNPYAYKILLANAALNRRKTNIYPLMFAATPEDGEVEFEYSDAGFCNGGHHRSISAWRHGHFFKLHVQGRNLLKFLEREYPDIVPRINYVKIDTEGADPEVAESIMPLLVANRPYIKTEIYRYLRADLRIAYYRRLRSLGYAIRRWQSHEDYYGPLLSEQDVVRVPHFDIFAVPQ